MKLFKIKIDFFISLYNEFSLAFSTIEMVVKKNSQAKSTLKSGA